MKAPMHPMTPRGRVPGSAFLSSARRRAGFTLIELMIALSLAAMLTLGIMVISNTAREIYIGTTKKVEAANRFRLSLLQADRDFSQWIDTSNLEFFMDGVGAGARRNSQWDEGEQIRDQSDELGPGVVDGGVFGEYDEFASIVERQYYGVPPGVDPFESTNRKLHDAYQAYFRTMTYVDGEYREANVEYMLLDPAHVDSRGNPLPPKLVGATDMANLVLVKIVRYQLHDYSDIVQRQRTFRVKRRRVEVASNVTDFKIEYTTENRYSNKISTRFVTPAEDFKRPAERETAPDRLTDPYNPALAMYRKTFGYGSVKADLRYKTAIAYKAIQGDRQPKNDHEPVRFGWEQPQDVFFAELVPGSEIFIFTPSSRGVAGGGAAAGGNRFIKFNTGTYTVKNNLSGRLEFYEDIRSATWEGNQSGLLYKASFLPTAVRITLRVVDDHGQNPRTFQRVVWIRRKAR